MLSYNVTFRATERTNAVHAYVEHTKEPNLLTKSICLISVSVAFSDMFPTNTVVATFISEAATLFYGSTNSTTNKQYCYTPQWYLQASEVLLSLYRAAFGQAA